MRVSGAALDLPYPAFPDLFLIDTLGSLGYTSC